VRPVLLVHGGAGRVPEGGGTGAREGLEVAASLAWRVLEGDGPALDAVLAAGRAGVAHITPFMAVVRRGGKA